MTHTYWEFVGAGVLVMFVASLFIVLVLEPLYREMSGALLKEIGLLLLTIFIVIFIVGPLVGYLTWLLGVWK